MPEFLTDEDLRKVPRPAKGNRIIYDGYDGAPKRTKPVIGFGLRVTAGGAKSFVFNYRIHNRERRYTIGTYGPDEWTLLAARKKAGELSTMVDQGIDPLAQREDARTAPTVGDLAKRFTEQHLPKKRESTRREYQAIIDTYILPELKHRHVSTVEYSDIDGLHRKITKAGSPFRANRTVAVSSKMFNLAIQWRMRRDNPCRGIERNSENKRTRYLTRDELKRLTAALSEPEDQQAANIIRLLLLTGARRGEVQVMKWADLDLRAGVWTKPGSTTKQKTEHRVPLSAPVKQLLVQLRDDAEEDAEFVFPGRLGGHRVEIKDQWAQLCTAAKIKGARLHDLRHTYASIIASSGGSLQLIGALLGHTQPSTTARYSHLFDDPLRRATERVGAMVSGKRSAKVVSFGKRA